MHAEERMGIRARSYRHGEGDGARCDRRRGINGDAQADRIEGVLLGLHHIAAECVSSKRLCSVGIVWGLWLRVFVVYFVVSHRRRLLDRDPDRVFRISSTP